MLPNNESAIRMIVATVAFFALIGRRLSLIVVVVNCRFARLNVSINQRAELISVPMLSSYPPCLEAGIRYRVGDCALTSPPQSFIERSIQEVKIKAVGKSRETSQMRAESRLRLGIQVVERLQRTKPKHRHFRILHKRFIQITPVRGQNVHRLALAFLVLIPNLSRQINDRNNHSDSAKHLCDGIDHLPVHNR